jgi:hypothetical protein
MSDDTGLGGDYEKCSQCSELIDLDRTPYIVVRDHCSNSEHYLHFNGCFTPFNIFHDFEVVETPQRRRR